MKKRIYLYADAGPEGRNYLRQQGTLKDIGELGVVLTEGQELPFYSGDADDSGNPDDLIFEGKVHFDTTIGAWYAVINEASYRHASEERGRT